jgi:AraC-like DNA-binding protein
VISIWTTLLALGIVQGLLVAFVLLSFKSANRVGNRLLALMLLLFSFLLLEEFIEATHLYKLYPKFLLSTFPLDAAFGPLIYLYMRSLFNRVHSKEISKHLLPIIGLSLLFFVFHFATPRGAFVWVNPQPTTFFIALVNLKILYLAGYFFLAWLPLRKTQTARANQIPTNNRIQLSILKIILMGMLILTLIIYFVFDWNIFFPHSLPASDTFTVVLITGSIYAITFVALRFPFVFSEVKPLEFYKEKIHNAQQLKNYKTSSLTPIQKESYTRQLLELMANEKLHRNQQIKVEDIAERMEIPSHHLSQVINEVLEKNFYEFVNFYRVQEVKGKMFDPAEAHKSLLGIALDAGFNSKASFNRVFKEFTGYTPSAFKRGQLQ